MPPITNLAAYYLDCVGRDRDDGISVFSSNRYGNPDYGQISQPPSIETNNDAVSLNNDVRAIIAKAQRGRQSSQLVLGYPLFMSWVTNKEGARFGFVEPLLYQVCELGAETPAEPIMAQDPPRINPADVFKSLSDRNYLVPRSEYMFKLVQPALDDVLFLSKSYEYYFDQCETFLALIFFDHRGGGSESGWGPPGRFAYKFQRSSANTFTDMLKDAEALKSEWPPLKAGLFGGSYERFQRVATGILHY